MYSSAFSTPTKLELRVFSRKTHTVDLSGVPDGSWGHSNILKPLGRDAEDVYDGYIDDYSVASRKFKQQLERDYPYPDNASNDEYTAWYDARDKATDKAVADGIIVKNPSAAALSKTLRDDYGFDALEIIDEPHRSSVGGSQVIVFDPERVVVVTG
jgi:hypothetical protein